MPEECLQIWRGAGEGGGARRQLLLCTQLVSCSFTSSSAPTALLSWWSLRNGSSLGLLEGDGHFPSTPVAGPTLPILQGQVGLAFFYLLFSSEWLVFHRYHALLLSGFALDYQNPFLVPVKPKKNPDERTRNTNRSYLSWMFRPKWKINFWGASRSLRRELSPTLSCRGINSDSVSVFLLSQLVILYLRKPTLNRFLSQRQLLLESAHGTWGLLVVGYCALYFGSNSCGASRWERLLF